MIGDELVKELVKKLSVIPGLSVHSSDISKKGKVYLLDKKFKGYIYIKAIADDPHRWGITKNIVNNLENKQIPWCIILLHDSEDTGYVISSQEYRERVAERLWPFAQGDYKITEGKSLKDIPKFSSMKELQQLFDSLFHEATKIDSIIENATQRAEWLRTKPAGESESHKKLKEYIRDNPSLVGIESFELSHLEYTLPSGDRVDVAFRVANNHWAVVEIELEGLNETIVGLFQAVKYRALQDAVLRVKNVQGTVEGILVARSILPQVKVLADILQIKTFEVTI